METFSMSPIPCIFSLGSERSLGRENSPSDYLGQINQHHVISVYDPKKDVVFYQESPAFEMSGFYSDEEVDDTQILTSQRSKLSMPIASKGVRVDAGLPCVASEVKLPVKIDDPPPALLPARSTRKRSLTNMFKARPEAVGSAQKIEPILPEATRQVKKPLPYNFPISNKGDPAIFPSVKLGQQPCCLDRIGLVDPSIGVLPSSMRHRVDICQGEEETFYENELLNGPLLLSTSQAIRILTRRNTPHETAETSISKASHLSQARKKLKDKTICRSIVVGYQPRKKGITAQEENECFQKIWMHQQNRIEAHRRMKSRLEFILEEEENLEILK